MKTLRDFSNLIGLGSLLTLAFGFTAALTYAGPGPQYWQERAQAAAERTKAADTPKESAKPVAAPAMVCPACKTQPLLSTQAPTSGFPGNRRPSPPKFGFKHTCEHCGGALTAQGGKMTNAMQGNCEMCGKDAARCVAAQHPAITA